MTGHYVTLSVPQADPSPFLRIRVADNQGRSVVVWHSKTLRDVAERAFGTQLADAEWFRRLNELIHNRATVPFGQFADWRWSTDVGVDR